MVEWLATENNRSLRRHFYWSQHEQFRLDYLLDSHRGAHGGWLFSEGE